MGAAVGVLCQRRLFNLCEHWSGLCAECESGYSWGRAGGYLGLSRGVVRSGGDLFDRCIRGAFRSHRSAADPGGWRVDHGAFLRGISAGGCRVAPVHLAQYLRDRYRRHARNDGHLDSRLPGRTVPREDDRADGCVQRRWCGVRPLRVRPCARVFFCPGCG